MTLINLNITPKQKGNNPKSIVHMQFLQLFLHSSLELLDHVNFFFFSMWN